MVCWKCNRSIYMPQNNISLYTHIKVGRSLDKFDIVKKEGETKCELLFSPCFAAGLFRGWRVTGGGWRVTGDRFEKYIWNKIPTRHQIKVFSCFVLSIFIFSNIYKTPRNHACENSHLSSLRTTRDVSPGYTRCEFFGTCISTLSYSMPC